MLNRVVITSIGVISSLGFSTDEILRRLKEGKVVFERSEFDAGVWTCPVGRDFNLRDFIGRYKNSRYLNRGAGFCVAAALDAVKTAGLSGEMAARSGLFVGSGPNLDIGGEFPEILDGNMDRQTLPALWILKFLPNTAASAIADLAGIHGENATIGTACSASLQAVGEAFRKIRNGYLDLALAGGGDSRLSPGAVLAYRKAQALWVGSGDCPAEYSPFDRSRKGFVPGEGGAFFLLESLEHARARGAKILAEVCGFGASMDGYNMTAPDPEGRWGEKAVRFALDEAGISPSGVDVVSAHGTGTPLNDEMEAGLIDRVFGGSKPFIIALKSWVGHLAAACGAMELAIGLACLAGGYFPPIRNLRGPCCDGLNFVRESMSVSAETMLLENFGFGGQNAALVVRKWTE
ncbi:MAG: beta-ketoacyl-[acyl-carrier-protein] synthase family protein [Syntrophobacteraceae bacterium]